MKYVQETQWEVVEEVSIRTLLERLKASGGNPHCMSGMGFIDNGEVSPLYQNWDWLQSLPNHNKKFLIVDMDCTTVSRYLT